MSDNRSNRGPHPKDHDLFAPSQIDAIRRAMSDFSWLLSRGYARPSSLKLVGDRHQLRERQRVALSRVACSDDEVALRKSKCLDSNAINGATLAIDGFNLITTIEAALSGGLLITCRDGCIRDIASMHGNYRRVSQTQQAIAIIGETLAALNVARAEWYLDKPVSNSGRLKVLLEETAAENDWDWSAELAYDPDSILEQSEAVAITSDSIILNECRHWFNLTGVILEQHISERWLANLSD
jgi:hypothetical protein